MAYTIGNFKVDGFPRREAEAMVHTMMGLSSKETGRLMGIQHRTVEVTLQHAIKRLDARNRVHLVAEAFAKGLITVRDTALSMMLASALALASIGSGGDWARNTTRRCQSRREMEVCLVTPAGASA